MNFYHAHTFLSVLKEKKIGKLIRENRLLSIRGFAEMTEIDKVNVRQLLHESFNMHKVYESKGA